jgi:tetratricopeptide (TPR) repeat protein
MEGVELPDLSDLEPVVRQTLEAALLAAQSSSPAEAAAAWGDLGRELHGHGFLPQAATAYRNAERFAPRSARWPYLQGLAALTAGDLAAARPAFARARELAPAAPWPRLRLASLRRQEGDFTGLDDLLLPVVDDTTLSRGLRALAATMRAEAARLEERLPAAIAAYRQALDLEPEASALRAPLAQLLRQSGELEGAARERALAGNRRPQAVDPEAEALESLDRSGAGFARRGQEALRRGDDPAALTALREAHRMSPGNAGVAVNLAVALQHLDQPDAARAVLTEALAADPQQPMANFNLGVLEAAAGGDRAAIAAYEAALRSDPRLLDARFNLANAHWRLGEAEAAIAAWRTVLAGDPLRSDARSALVRVLAASQDRAGALALADEGLHLAPSDPDRMEEVARLLATATADAGGDSARALKLAEACLAASRTLDHVETAAMAYAAAGRFLDAARWQQAAVRVAEEAGATDRRDQLAGVLARYLAGQTAAAPWPGWPTIRNVGRLPGAVHAPTDR